MKNIFLAFVLLLASQLPALGAAAPQPGRPLQDAPQQLTDRTTAISVILESTDSIGSRLSTRLKEKFNQSSLFRLNGGEDNDSAELRILLNTAPEFPSRPQIGSVYGICWVFSQGKGYLPYLLAREIGTLSSEDVDALADKLVERTDGIATKYANLWK